MDYIKLDLSFIPTYDFPEDLLEFDGQEVVMPYTEPKLKYSFDNMEETKKELIATRRYHDYEYAMMRFAAERQEIGDLSLAEKCFRYLIEMGSIQAQIFDRLIDIYYFQNDQQSILWLKDKLNKAISLSFDYNYQKKKLIPLREKLG